MTCLAAGGQEVCAGAERDAPAAGNHEDTADAKVREAEPRVTERWGGADQRTERYLQPLHNLPRRKGTNFSYQVNWASYLQHGD